MNGLWMYTLKERYECRILEFNKDGSIGRGSASCERKWKVDKDAIVILGDYGETCKLSKENDTLYSGKWSVQRDVNVQLEKVDDKKFMYNTVNLNCHDINIGDMFSAPSRYYDQLGYIDSVNHHAIIKKEICVIGGGGLMHKSFQEMLNRRMQVMGDRCIFWGIGSNNHDIMNSYFYDYLKKSPLVGVRDYVGDYRWVPCASCKHPVFDACFMVKPKYEYMYFIHKEFKSKLPSWVDTKYPVIFNDSTNIVDVCMKLSLGDTIITNTYHGSYWSTIMGKKVVVYPFSNRFFNMKHEPLIVRENVKLSDIKDMTRSYPHALQECRNANDEFYKDAINKIKELSDHM